VTPRDALVSLLRAAFSGELAAAIAYHGHERSVADADEKREIRRIRRQELKHRRAVGRMLGALGARPSRWRELRASVVGRLLWVWCFAGGWFTPMYGAGRLERRNIAEYETAARLALEAGRQEFVHCLLEMAEVEWDHERYFHAKARSHWLMRALPDWDDPPPRAEIRRSLAVSAGPPSPATSAAPPG
jgi:rubrerythrin